MLLGPSQMLVTTCTTCKLKLGYAGALSIPQLQLVAQHLCSYHRTWAQQCELGIRQHFISFFNFWSTLRGSKLLRPLVCHEIVMMLEYDLVVVHVSLLAAQKENISFIGPLQ